MNTEPKAVESILDENVHQNAFKNFYNIESVKNDLQNLLKRLNEMGEEDTKWAIDRFSEKLNKRDLNLVNLFYNEISLQTKIFEDSDEETEKSKEYRDVMDLYSAIKFIKYKHTYK